MKIKINFNYILIIIAAVLWGTIGIFINYLSENGFAPLQLVTVRAGVTAAVVLGAILVSDPGKLRIRLKDIWIFACNGICSFVFFNYCYFSAIKLIGLSASAVLLYTAPVFVTLLAFVLFKEKLTLKKIIALPIALAGCALISGAGNETAAAPPLGILLGLGSGFGYALYTIFGRTALKRYDTLTVTFYTFLSAFIGMLLLPSSNAFSIPAAVKTPGIFIMLTLLGIVTSAIPYLCYTKGLSGAADASKAPVIACAEPLVASLIGIALYGESFTVPTAAGMICVLTAIFIIRT